MTAHRQVPVRVTAYVDEGIKELVEVLNRIDGIMTFESCEGHEGKPAFVLADYGGERRNFSESDFIEMAVFMYRLVRAYNNNKRVAGRVDGAADVYISIRWTGGVGVMGDHWIPEILIEMPHDCIKDVARVFNDLRAEFGACTKHKSAVDC